jgi:hypothetical protein
LPQVVAVAVVAAAAPRAWTVDQVVVQAAQAKDPEWLVHPGRAMTAAQAQEAAVVVVQLRLDPQDQVVLAVPAPIGWDWAHTTPAVAVEQLIMHQLPRVDLAAAVTDPCIMQARHPRTVR